MEHGKKFVSQLGIAALFLGIGVQSVLAAGDGRTAIVASSETEDAITTKEPGSGSFTLPSQMVYNESGGLVIMEMENTESLLGLWQKKTSLTNHTGSGYLEFTGNEHTDGPPNSPLVYHFKINQGGTYLIDLHCAKMMIGDRDDLANDAYIRVVGDFTSEPGPHDIPRGNASINMLKTDTKYFGGGIDAWEWASGDYRGTGGRLDPGGKKNKRTAIYNFKSGETYTLIVSGRSKSFRINRIMFRRTSVSASSAQSLSRSESSTFPGVPPTPTDLDIRINAADFDSESHPGNDSVIKDSGTYVNYITDGSWICFDNFDFGTSLGGSIDVDAGSASEGGTIELRTDSPTGTLIGTVKIKHTHDWADYTTFSANFSAVSGKKDLYFVFKGESGGLYNLDSFTFRSGFPVDVKLETPPIRPPIGRVAYVADGNSSDPDDIGANAAALAMFSAAGLTDRLVYFAHSCDLIRADNTSEAEELNRFQLLQTSCDGTASRWGGFDHITFWNCKTQQTEAVSKLKDQINASSASDPLWIIEAGEPDIIGYALDAADPSKWQYVKLLTHHPVNDHSGDHYKWRDITPFGTDIVFIPDQNGYGFSLSKGLQRPLWAYYWARDHADPRFNWIWEQGKIAEEDGVVGFQDGKFDISDAGMVFYWITGADSNGGYRHSTVHDIKDLLENATDPQDVVDPVAHWKLDEGTGRTGGTSDKPVTLAGGGPRAHDHDDYH